MLQCVLAVAVCVLVFTAGIQAEPKSQTGARADWPNWRGPTHNGISKEATWGANWPQGGPKVLWRASLGTGFCSFAVSDGRVYTAGNIKGHDIVYCFDAGSGKVIWKHRYRHPLDANLYEGGPSATPTVDGNVVYTFSKRGIVFCLEAATGKVIWQRDVHKELGAKIPEWGFAGSPRALGRLLILNAGGSGIALEKDTGKVAWKSSEGPAGYATPVALEMNGQRCLAIFSHKDIFIVDGATGSVLWSMPWKTSYDINAADPLIFGGKMFITSGYARGCGLISLAGGKPKLLWQNKNMSSQFSSPVLHEGHLYGVDRNVGRAQLVCMDFSTGQVKWRQKIGRMASLMLADGKLIVMIDGGKLLTAEASPEGFKKISEAKILTRKCWTVAVLAGGRIYARNAFGQMVCLDVSKGS